MSRELLRSLRVVPTALLLVTLLLSLVPTAPTRAQNAEQNGLVSTAGTPLFTPELHLPSAPEGQDGPGLSAAASGMARPKASAGLRAQPAPFSNDAAPALQQAGAVPARAPIAPWPAASPSGPPTTAT